mmetsp:Transcript_2063/g.7975  ORF Transcript_2063/g.7975 Transcript_2063/m.7975 type:complete len:181 (+) Transcript_2063:43-585(+)|eukprot:CAMPEP_0185688742 /NCGR_PEP_ID=MMETSP1164-20130828/24_1 /TAXON_ID=1104430 /ORGANISM="Chrysoreinhardia sp, Strain CCMP2950" /LENGTH=180 /DNA_ID=CAMNT_0028355201 /DNA_START=31 /DNA_END=573 /DNA_ORIENTATION=+
MNVRSLFATAPASPAEREPLAAADPETAPRGPPNSTSNRGLGRRCGGVELCPSRPRNTAVSNADKPRKAPVKVDPKVFFANERTFLAWLHMALVLGGISIGIIAFSDKHAPWSAAYGFVLLPVAIAFVVYALRQYYARARAIRAREPGPYEDRTGPYALGMILILATVTNVVIHFAAAGP